MEIKDIMNNGRLKGRHVDVDVRELNGRNKTGRINAVMVNLYETGIQICIFQQY